MTPSPRPDPLDDLRSDQPASAPTVAETESLEREAEGAKIRDRSALGRGVVWAFLGVLVVLIAYILLGTVVWSWEVIETPAKFAAQTISSVLLPVVTLVLGYYFGTANGSP